MASESKIDVNDVIRAIVEPHYEANYTRKYIDLPIAIDPENDHLGPFTSIFVLMYSMCCSLVSYWESARKQTNKKYVAYLKNAIKVLVVRGFMYHINKIKFKNMRAEEKFFDEIKKHAENAKMHPGYNKIIGTYKSAMAFAKFITAIVIIYTSADHQISRSANEFLCAIFANLTEDQNKSTEIRKILSFRSNEVNTKYNKLYNALPKNELKKKVNKIFAQLSFENIFNAEALRNFCTNIKFDKPYLPIMPPINAEFEKTFDGVITSYILDLFDWYEFYETDEESHRAKIFVGSVLSPIRSAHHARYTLENPHEIYKNLTVNPDLIDQIYMQYVVDMYMGLPVPYADKKNKIGIRILRV